MPEVIMKFNLPEDKSELEIAQKAWNFLSTLIEADDALRSVTKYDDVSKLRDHMDEEENGKLTDDQIITACYGFREMLRKLRDENNAYCENE